MENKLLLSISGVLLFTGCSMMPYHNDFACQGGSNVKICKRVSDIYKDSDNINKNYQCPNCPKTTQTQQINYNNENYYLKLDNQIKTKENNQLKDMVEAISYTKLHKPIEIVITKNNGITDKNKIVKINGTNKNSKEQNKKIILNKKIEVCVLNANIRKKPSCKSKIIKVAHKHQKLYAYYIENSWIKLKNGYIHKSLVCQECNLQKEKK